MKFLLGDRNATVNLVDKVSERDRESDVQRVKGYDGGGIAGRRGRS